jgi:hypothetical protein
MSNDKLRIEYRPGNCNILQKKNWRSLRQQPFGGCSCVGMWWKIKGKDFASSCMISLARQYCNRIL